MYSFFSEISSWLVGPFMNIAHSLEALPIFFAIALGIVGALAPCQFVGNISAITIYGNRSIQRKIVWKDVISFIFGKVIAFSLLGFFVWLLGREIQDNLTLYFPWLRKMMGPLLVIVGLFMIGYIKLSWTLNLFKLSNDFKRENPLGSFLLGFSYSLAFCPTMFILFFVTLMPVVLSNSYGFILPTLFAFGTALPLIIIIFLIWYLGGSGLLMKKGRKLGLIIQRISGVVIFLIGILDTMTYWSL